MTVKFDCLLEMGSSIFTIDPKFLKAYTLPNVKRDIPSRVVDMAKRIVNDSGEVFTIPLTFCHGNYADSQSWDIIPLDGSCEMIILFW